MGHAGKMRGRAGIVAPATGLLLVLLAACASSSKENIATATFSTPGDATDGGPEAAADSTAPTDANGAVASEDVDPRATACTAAPYVSFAATLTTLDVSGATQPLAGASIGFTTCAGFLLTTDSSGKAATQITEGAPLSPIYSAGTAVLSAIGAEIPATADASVSPVLFARDVAPAIPGFVQDGGDAPTIVIALGVSGSTAPCTDATGVTFAVTGHPEAVVGYGSATWPADPSVTTTSNGTGYVFVNGISGGGAASTRVTVTGAKTGCTVQIASPTQTGAFALLGGSVTVGVATVTN